MKRIFFLIFAMVVSFSAISQDARYDKFYNNSLYASNWCVLSAKQRLDATWFTTSVYKKEAFSLILSEGNRAAKALKLDENLPIAENKLVSAFVGAPIMEIKGQGIGNISTTNYTYYVGAGNKLCSIVRMKHDQLLSQLVENYRWPSSRMNTNAARKLAIGWMKSAKMDVKKLNQNCQISVEPVTFDDEGDTNHFAPIYHINWKIPADNQYKWHTIASVELFLPTKTLLDMTVEDPKYILGPSLVVMNEDYMSNLVQVVSHAKTP